ncbi:MAG TPA: hypothetical protein PLF71_05145 [bacterium]|nr:hypothetical protein [bacterium]
MKNWNFAILCVVISALVTGCIINKPAPSAPLSASEPLPWETGATVQVEAGGPGTPAASASAPVVATPPSAPVVATAIALPIPYIPPTPPAPPHVVSRRPVGQAYLQTTVDTEAPDIMSVRLVNDKPFYACLISPTLMSGEPVFKPRAGAFAQDFMPPEARVPCMAVLAPRLPGMPGDGPTADLAVTAPGTYTLRVIYYTHSTNPVRVRMGNVRTFSFPNVPGAGTQCSFPQGCLYKHHL